MIVNRRIQLVFMCFYIFTLKSQVDVTWANAVGVTINGNTITKTTSIETIAGASSANVLGSGQNGWAEFTITQSGQIIAFGFSQRDVDQTTATIEYRFDLDGNNLNIFALGSLEGVYGPCEIGDVLRIERDGLDINFYNKSKLLTTIPLLYNTTPLIIDASISAQGSAIANANTSFSAPLAVNSITKDVYSIVDSLGSIEQTITGGIPPYSINWFASVGSTDINNSTTANMFNLDVGQYTSTITDAIGSSTLNLNYIISNKIDWKDSLAVFVTDSSLIKASEVASWTNSGAYSLQEIKASEDGYIFHKVTNVNSQYAIGVSRVETDYNYEAMESSFLITNNRLSIYKKRYLKFITELIIGDEILMDKRKDTVYFYLNNVLIYTQKMDSLMPLCIQTSLYTANMELKQTCTSFKRPIHIRYIQYDVQCRLNQDGEITVTPNGGIAPYKYKLNEGALSTVNTFTNLAEGTYTLTVEDKNTRIAKCLFTIYKCPIWVNPSQNATINTKGDIIKTNGDNSWNDIKLTTAEPFVFDVTPVWLSFTVPDTISEYLIGFRSVLGDSTAQITNYKLYIKNALVTIIETDNDGFYNKRNIALVTNSSSFKIQLTPTGIAYYILKNDKISYELMHESKLFSDDKLIIEAQLFKLGSKVNSVRVSAYGNITNTPPNTGN